MTIYSHLISVRPRTPRKSPSLLESLWKSPKSTSSFFLPRKTSEQHPYNNKDNAEPLIPLLVLITNNELSRYSES